MSNTCSYFELVLPIGPGVKKHPLFFLPRSWLGKKLHFDNDVNAAAPPDVEQERERTNAPDNNSAIRVLGINKVYPARGGMPPKLAVKSLTMAIEHGECFGFLGPNG